METACTDSGSISDEGTEAADKRGNTWVGKETEGVDGDEERGGMEEIEENEETRGEKERGEIGTRPVRRASPDKLVVPSFLSFLQLSSWPWPR